MNFQVIDLARLNHDNIAKFLGYCRESDPFSRMLVFEYASNGTLFEHLHCKLFFFCFGSHLYLISRLVDFIVNVFL
jgi:serine/threonine protein kinase